ncbi:hypothetical protein LH427_01975 [Laribacter hongkongensis]|uniref:hypothetical protein n=1 Tax=Laribacter hongkongensis TaxID=168471 RepID=UPI001EFE8EE4|nr:hypothetical protein [Laribacter hongkongensis]MCG8991786.1 hypothetical protein [Laribacter hongkongensis]MCG8998711.1 hypothetical protein [Laribacter hongkongensis]MCG9000215.1 hypothetical protein [Laribacter hongkongensis]MCG9004428.1 hypothetical protein [Laribacter hongkongensis]MCG9006605.1 hypothetical protein [Laribacter hongkongensis]
MNNLKRAAELLQNSAEEIEAPDGLSICVGIDTWNEFFEVLNAELESMAQAEPDGWKHELLDWVSACQSAYHIDNTPGHRFGGLGSNLEENRTAVVEYVEALLNCAPQPSVPPGWKLASLVAPTIEAAREIGAKGGEANDAERLAFEAWMAGHCWSISAAWNGTSYVSPSETVGYVCPHAMRTRQLWAAWRDRAALAAAQAQEGGAA